MPVPIPLDSKDEEDFARLMAFPDSDDEDVGEGSAWPKGSTSGSTLAPPNLIQSYTALLVLGLLSDDFKRVNRAGLLRFLARCQSDDGSWVPFRSYGESSADYSFPGSFLQFPGCPEPGDPRSTYSAFTISSILDDWTAVDIDQALDFLSTSQVCHLLASVAASLILSLLSQRPEGGFGARPFAEPQGGLWDSLEVTQRVVKSQLILRVDRRFHLLRNRLLLALLSPSFHPKRLSPPPLAR